MRSTARTIEYKIRYSWEICSIAAPLHTLLNLISFANKVGALGRLGKSSTRTIKRPTHSLFYFIPSSSTSRIDSRTN